MSPSDARYCAEIANTNARTFSLAAKLLPAEKRRGAFALYAFCRTADDIVDRSRPGASVDAIQLDLQTYTRRVLKALDGAGAGPVERELAWACARFAVPGAAITELLNGVGQDLLVTSYESWENLESYCQGVASSVGEMCAAVFGLPADAAVQRRAVGSARTLGVAMQLTNILRDVGEDAARGRCYLPRRDLAEFGFSVEDVLSGRPLAQLPEWQRAMQLQIARARSLYREAIPAISLLAPDAQACASACAHGYARILEAIEANHFDNLTQRARVAWPARARVLFDAWRGRSKTSTDEAVRAAVA
jgi:phytoene synthase